MCASPQEKLAFLMENLGLSGGAALAQSPLLDRLDGRSDHLKALGAERDHAAARRAAIEAPSATTSTAAIDGTARLSDGTVVYTGNSSSTPIVGRASTTKGINCGTNGKISFSPAGKEEFLRGETTPGSEQYYDASLLAAVDRGNTDAAVALLRAADKRTIVGIINAVCEDGSTPLMYAAEKGDAAVVAALLRTTGLDGGNAVDLNVVNIVGYTALILAAANGHTTIVKELVIAVGIGASLININAATKDGMTALIWAAKDGTTEIVNTLLGASSNFLGRLEIPNAAVAVDLNAVDTNGNTALIWAAHKGHAAIVDALVTAVGKGGEAVDLNVADIPNGNTALISAAGIGHVEIVCTLLTAVGKGGEDVHVNVKNKHGAPALKAAIHSKSLETVKVLLGLGCAHVDESLLIYAEKYGTTAIVHVLQKRMPTKTCSACKENKYHSEYAKAQLKKSGADRRCASCVDQGKLAPNAKAEGSSDATLLQCSACAVEKAPAHFSKAQRGKKDARKCGECIKQVEINQKEAKAEAAAAELLEEEAASSGTLKQEKRHKKKQAEKGMMAHARNEKESAVRRKRAEKEREHEAKQLAAKRKAQKDADQAKETALAVTRKAEWQAAKEAAAAKKKLKKMKGNSKKAHGGSVGPSAVVAPAPAPAPTAVPQPRPAPVHHAMSAASTSKLQASASPLLNEAAHVLPVPAPAPAPPQPAVRAPTTAPTLQQQQQQQQKQQEQQQQEQQQQEQAQQQDQEQEEESSAAVDCVVLAEAAAPVAPVAAPEACPETSAPLEPSASAPRATPTSAPLAPPTSATPPAPLHACGVEALCDMCAEDPALHHCKECAKSFCADCLAGSHRKGLSKFHAITTIAEGSI